MKNNFCYIKGWLCLLLFLGQIFCCGQEIRVEEIEKIQNLDRRALQAYNQGNYAKAYDLWFKLIIILEKKFRGKDHPSIAYTYSNLGETSKFLDMYDRALEYHKKALQMRKRLYNEKTHIETAESYNNLGALHLALGNLQDAWQNFTKAIKMRECIYHNEPHQILAESYINLSVVLHEMGKLEESLEFCNKALYIIQNMHEESNSNSILSKIYSVNGLILSDLGRLEEALQYYNKALQLNRSIYKGENHPDLANVYNDLGTVFQDLGRLDDALESHKKALEMRLHLEKKSDIAISYNNIGIVLGNLGKFKESLEHFLKSLSIYEFMGIKSDIAIAYSNIGGAFDSLGILDKALYYYLKALEMNKSVYNQDHSMVAISYNNLGYALWKLGRLQQSFQNYTKAVEMERNLFKNYALLGGSLYKQEQFLRRLSGRSFHGLFIVLSKRPQSKHAGFAYESLVFRKTVMHDILLRERQIAKENQNPKVREIYEEYQSTVQELANLAYRPMEGEKELDRYKNLTDQKESLEAKLTKEIRDLVKIEPVSLSQIQEKLSHDTSLWEWVKYYDYDKKEYYYGCFILRHSSLKFVVVSPATPLEEAVRNLLKKIKDDLKEYCSLYNHKGKEQAESFLQEQELKVWKKASELRKVLCSQDFISSWKESKSIILAPDGILHFFPWAMLAFQDKSGKRKYFAEEKDFVYCLSGASLLKNPNSLPEKPIYYGLSSPDFNLPIQEEKNLVAMWQKKTLDSIPKILAMDLGNTKIALKGQAQLFWPSLDASTQEAEMCSQWFQHAFPQSEIHISKKKEALEIVFKAMSQEAHWLHLSTHGFFLESEDSKEEKNILDSFTERRLVLKQGTHPLLLSGIVLAGANLPKPQEINMDDGYLTAQEIATLDLSKVHCAVFSCCDTGLGKSELATGFSGLKTALAAAGVNHSIITLWNVLEQQSGNQLSLFYSYVFQYKMPVTQAINKTQRSTLLISKFRHPCLWASFLCYSNSIQPQ